MPPEIIVFLGSSSERADYAKSIQSLIEEEREHGVSAIGWWDEGVFPAGSSFLHSLFEITKHTNAALFIAGPDDIIASRGAQHASLRDNVLFEYGLFAGVHGQQRAAIALLSEPGTPDPQLPSDLAGIAVVKLVMSSSRSDFMRHNRGAILGWIDQISKVPKAIAGPPLPLLWQAMIRVVSDHRRATPDWAQQIDRLASELLEPIVGAFGEDYGINDQLTEGISRSFLAQCSCLHAVDVLGPQGWISPTAYRYLARQIREYISRNSAKGTWSVTVSESLGSTIRRAIQAAETRSIFGRPVLEHSLSEFHNTEGDRWVSGTPIFEFARILLWSRQELLSGVAESIIAIHEAFHIPLFFREIPVEDPLRDFDFLYFQTSGHTDGFYGDRRSRYRTEPISSGLIPLLGSVDRHFRSLLEDPNLLLATDARQILRAEMKREAASR